MPAQVSTYRVIARPKPSRTSTTSLGHIALTSPQNAALVVGTLQEAAQSLSILPHRYPVRERRRDATKTVRSMPVPPFMLYYRVDDMIRVVRVLTIRHGHQRQPQRFP